MVAFAALLPRLYVALAWAREPVWDGHYYDFGARRIAAGRGYSDDVVVGGVPVWHPWCHYPVGYSGLLGLAYRLFGHGQYVGPLLNAVTGVALAAVTYRLARHATGEWRARAAGLLVALHPGLIAYTALLMTEVLAALGLALAAWVGARSRGSLRGSLAAGLVLGLTTLVRPQSILLAPAIGLFAWHGAAHGLRWRRAWRSGLCATAIALAVVAPWTVRNCALMDGCAFVSTNAGWNLAIGSFPRATGRFETLKASDGCHIVTGQVQQDRCWLRAGMDWIRADPARWLALGPRKLGLTFDHESFPIGYLSEADPAAWPPELRERARQGLTLAHRCLLLISMLGVVAWPLRRAGRWPFGGGRLGVSVAQLVALGLVALLGWQAVSSAEHPFWPAAVAIPLLAVLPLPGRPRNAAVIGYIAFTIATVCVTHAVFFGEDRYHMVVSPLLCLLAACALRRAREQDALPAAARAGENALPAAARAGSATAPASP